MRKHYGILLIGDSLASGNAKYSYNGVQYHVLPDLTHWWCNCNEIVSIPPEAHISAQPINPTGWLYYLRDCLPSSITLYTAYQNGGGYAGGYAGTRIGDAVCAMAGRLASRQRKSIRQIVINAGFNDGAQPVAQITAGLQSCAATARQFFPNAKVIALSATCAAKYANGNDYGYHMRTTVQGALLSACLGQPNLIYVDGITILRRYDLLARDHVHLTENSARMIACAIANYIKAGTLGATPPEWLQNEYRHDGAVSYGISCKDDYFVISSMSASVTISLSTFNSITSGVYSFDFTGSGLIDGQWHCIAGNAQGSPKNICPPYERQVPLASGYCQLDGNPGKLLRYLMNVRMGCVFIKMENTVGLTDSELAAPHRFVTAEQPIALPTQYV